MRKKNFREQEMKAIRKDNLESNNKFSIKPLMYCFPFHIRFHYLRFQVGSDPAGNYMFKVTNRNTRARCEICSKLTIKTPEGRHWRCSGVFIVKFENISHLILVFLLLDG